MDHRRFEALHSAQSKKKGFRKRAVAIVVKGHKIQTFGTETMSLNFGWLCKTDVFYHNHISFKRFFFLLIRNPDFIWFENHCCHHFWRENSKCDIFNELYISEFAKVIRMSKAGLEGLEEVFFPQLVKNCPKTCYSFYLSFSLFLRSLGSRKRSFHRIHDV